MCSKLKDDDGLEEICAASSSTKLDLLSVCSAGGGCGCGWGDASITGEPWVKSSDAMIVASLICLN